MTKMTKEKKKMMKIKTRMIAARVLTVAVMIVTVETRKRQQDDDRNSQCQII